MKDNLDEMTIEELRDRRADLAPLAEEHETLSMILYLIDEGFILMDCNGGLHTIADAEEIDL